MQITRTGVILNTERYEACVAFYRDVLGLEVLFEKSWEEDGKQEGLTCFDFGGAYLMVETGGRASDGGTKPVESCPMKLRFNSRDLDADAAHLEARGIAVTRTDNPWGRTAEFCDPDGNRCALREERNFMPADKSF